jgi:hypothetical protein
MAAAPPLGNDMRLALALMLLAAPLSADTYFLIVGGLGGETRYDERFAEEVGKLAEVAARTAGEESHIRRLEGEAARRDSIVDAFLQLKTNLGEDDLLSVFLVGHGSYDGGEYKFNIPGPDLTAERLASLMSSVPAKRQLVALTTSCSGAALEALQAPGRIVVTATKNGRERNATVFSKYWAEALEDPEADTDKNDVISVQEAFSYADAKVKTFFESTDHLATEHPQMQGELAASFTLARLGAAAQAIDDPALRPLLDRREKLQMQVDGLKLKKDAMNETDYFSELQDLLVELAMVEAEITSKQGEEPAASDDPPRQQELRP